jgi:hypothetical protein
MSGVSNTRRLRALIQAVRDQHGWSYDEISQRTGRKLGKSLVHKLATETSRDDLLPVDQIRALAIGLDVSFAEVRDAALADLGFLDGEDTEPDVAAVIRSDLRLLPEAREHLLRQYALLLRLTQPAASEEDLRAAMMADIEAAERDEGSTQP